MRNTTLSAVFAIVAALLITSCAPKYGAYFQSSTPAGYGAKAKKSEQPAEQVAPETTEASEALTAEAGTTEADPVETKTAIEKALKENNLPTTREELSDEDRDMLDRLKTSTPEMQKEILKAEMKRSLENMTKEERKETRERLKTALKDYRIAKREARRDTQGEQRHADSDLVLVILVILAIVIPPLAVLIHDGGATTNFWVSLLLALLAIISFPISMLPAIIWSLIVILDLVSLN